MQTQAGNRGVIQPRRRSAKGDKSENPRRTHNVADLLGIVEAREKIAREQCLGGGAHAAGAKFATDPDARSERINGVAAGEVEGRQMFATSRGAKAEPAETAGIKQGPENFHAGSGRWYGGEW